MSQVYLKDRKETVYDVTSTAAELQDAITIYVMNEKRVPKKWRYMIGREIIKKCDELVDNVIEANETWAKGEENMAHRREYWGKALRNCKQLDRKLTRAKNVIPTVTPDSLKQIIELLWKEEGLLIHKKKNDKETG